MKIFRFFVAFTFICSVLSPRMQAVSPPPDGGYPGQNTAEGANALFSLSPNDGAFNTAIGWRSLFANTTGSLNTGVGAGTLLANISHNNTAIGAGALALNTTGDGNTANGALALLQNTEGRGNTAMGGQALFSNTTGQGNTAVGARALLNNTTGTEEESSLNTAIGLDALGSNTTGGFNTAVGGGTNDGPAGAAALGSNTTGRNNTAVGGAGGANNGALGFNTTGSGNTAIGQGALNINTTGEFNIAVGVQAGSNLTTGDSNIDIGNNGVADESNTIRIGTSGEQTAAFIAGISGTAVVGDAVVVDGNGQLGTVASSARFKKNIKPMDKTSEAILALKPVSFQYRSDSKGTPQFGLIAEEVAKVNSDLVVRNRNGEIYSVRYDQVNAMLLNEFLKEHRKVEEQVATITKLKQQIEALSAGLQKVSAQLELIEAKPQTVLHSH
jgi:hypothetical protein